MTASLISPSGAVLLHRARRSTTPAEEADAKAVRVWFRKECRLEENRTFLKHRNVRAFLRALSESLACEPDSLRAAAGDPCRFHDFSTHPAAADEDATTEAGAYRITAAVWRKTGALMGLANFTPETQDLIAVEILRGLGAVSQIQAGDVWAALVAAAARWPGLPASDYARFCEVYKRLGGTINELGGALAFGGRPAAAGAKPASANDASSDP